MKPLKARLQLKPRRCPYCGACFRPVRHAQRFDTASCRALYWHYLHEHKHPQPGRLSPPRP